MGSKRPTKFDRESNRGLKTCPLCHKRTWQGLGYGDYCEKCTDELEQTNAHYDGVHDTYPNPDGCPLCRGEED